MTAVARIKQNDITRAIRAAKLADPTARVILDFKAQRIEIALGSNPQPAVIDDDEDNPWEEDARP